MPGRILSKERRKQWLAAINLKKINTKIARGCSRHFISGKCAKLTDNLNPDWVPSLHLGYAGKSNPSLSAGRFQRYKKHIAKRGCSKIPVRSVKFNEQVENTLRCEKLPNEGNTSEECLEEEYLQKYLDEINPVQEPRHISMSTQTDLVSKQVVNLFLELEKKNRALEEKELEISELKKNISKLKMGSEFFEDGDVKTRYFTGFSHYLTLITIYKAIEESILFLRLQNFDLKLDLPFKLLGFMFGISTQTASKKFHECILVLRSELNSFVSWPDKETRAHFTPE